MAYKRSCSQKTTWCYRVRAKHVGILWVKSGKGNPSIIRVEIIFPRTPNEISYISLYTLVHPCLPLYIPVCSIPLLTRLLYQLSREARTSYWIKTVFFAQKTLPVTTHLIFVTVPFTVMPFRLIPVCVMPFHVMPLLGIRCLPDGSYGWLQLLTMTNNDRFVLSNKSVYQMMSISFPFIQGQ